MLHITVDLARRIESAEISFCALAAGAGLASVETGGARAIYAGPGSPLNKVLGLGLGCDADDADLEQIEAFYRRHASDVRIELCPLAESALPTRLSERGYLVHGFENELVRRLPASASFAIAPGVTVDAAGDDAADTWVQVVSDGFGAAGLMQSFVRPAIARYLARVDGTPAGGGASWVDGGVAGVFGTSTLPEFRRRGVQRAIVTRCLDDAIGRADLAIATVDPGSTSQRTFERLGFQVAYTRVVFARSA